MKIIREKVMKRKLGTIAALLLCVILTTVNIWADDGKGQDPDYVTDYYMVVQSAEGGINIYAESDPQSEILNDQLIINGTAIHIQGEKDGTDNKKWAYTQYHGMNGYIPMDDLKPVTRSEAIKEEINTLGGKDVDFEVKIQGDDGKASVYNGPGEKFGEVSGTSGIENDTTVHISQYVHGEDGINWGRTDTDGVDQGWLNLDRDTDYTDKSDDETAVEAAASGDKSVEGTLTPEETVTPTPEATPTPQVTATPTPEATPTPQVTVTPTPEATPTSGATVTPEATPTSEATATPEVNGKENTDKKEIDKKSKPGKDDSQKVSGKNVKSDSGMLNPVVWISGIGIVIIIGLLIYFLKKKK